MAYFDTFYNTLYNLFVSLTTSNYPDIMMPIFQENRFAALYFISFMGIVAMVLLHIILAYFYYNYKTELLDQARTFHRSESFSELTEEVDDIDESMTESSIRRSSRAQSMLNDPDEILEEIERLQKEEMEIMFGNAPWRKALLDTLNGFTIKTIFAFGSLLAFVLAVIQCNEVSPDPQTDFTPAQALYDQTFNKYWVISEFIINAFLLLDPLLRVTAVGWKYFVKAKYPLFEFILTTTLLFLLSLRIFVIDTLSLTPIKYLLVLKIARFVRWVDSFEKYKLIFHTLVKLGPLFADLLGVIGIVFYLYSTLGDVLFGGYLKTNINLNLVQYGDPQYYVYVNFNDFWMGLFTCFHLLVVNNWLFTADVHCKILGNHLYRIYFVSFYIIAVTICLNIMIAFILDLFLTQISNKNEKLNPRKISDPFHSNRRLSSENNYHPPHPKQN